VKISKVGIILKKTWQEVKREEKDKKLKDKQTGEESSHQ
jgi:hypothetical protein